VYVIDVSQAVEHDHPNALLFLRKDCENAVHFFRKHGVARVPHLQPLFEFVVDATIRPDDVDAAYERMLVASEAGEGDAHADGGDGGRDGAAARAEAQIAEAVFAQMHIPRTMDELAIRDAERDVATIAAGKGASLAYSKVMGLNAALQETSEGVAATADGAASGAPAAAGVEGEEEGEEEEESDDESDDEGEEGEEGEERRRGNRRQLHRDEDKDAKRERKAAVKAAQKEARTHKTPKHVKKAKCKAGKK
jgi:RIO kinase 1